jgi:hypothetical protein
MNEQSTSDSDHLSPRWLDYAHYLVLVAAFIAVATYALTFRHLPANESPGA